MRSPPTGDVTLVFTDIEGSTRLWQLLSGGFQTILRHHHIVMRTCLAAHHGYEVKTEGDSFMIAFSDPQDAVAFCVDAQERLFATRWPVELMDDVDPAFGGLRVRMGVHWGSPTCAVDAVTQRMDYFGLMVNRASRIAHAALGGQILISREVFDGIQWDEIDGVVTDLGPRPLRDLHEVTHLYQVLPKALSHRIFGSPNATRWWRTNLVTANDSFVGRTAELKEMESHIQSETRLLTIIGAGGTGKTRVASHFGRQHLSDFEGGVWFADLSIATSRQEVCQSVGDALGIPLTASDTIEQVGNAIRARGRTLLILDNLEHLIADAAPLLSAWMKAAPAAFFIVTSRERLRMAGETLLYLDPLDTEEAVLLFATRARAVRPDFELTPKTRVLVEEIVGRLDCMSLAIELAAARCSILRPEQLLQRLSQRFRLLRGGKRDASHRQATLRNAIDWSWRLLEPSEQAGLAQLSVFAAPFTLEAAEAVLILDGYPDSPWPMDIVASLRDKSLLRLFPSDEGEHDLFGMYQTVQEYAAEKLEDRPDEGDAARRCHMDFYAGISRGITDYEFKHGKGYAVLLAEYQNLYRAFESACEGEDPISVGDIVAGLLRVLGRKGPYETAMQISERFLEMDGTSLAHRARVTCSWVKAKRYLTPVDEMLPKIRQAREWAIESDDFSAEMECRRLEVQLALDLGQNEQIPDYVGEALERCSERGVEAETFYFYCAMADYHMFRGEIAEVQYAVDRAASLVSAYRLAGNIGIISHKRGRVYEDKGKLTDARLCYEQGLTAYIQFGDMRGQSILLGCLANIHRVQGRYDEAKKHYAAALRIHKDWGNPFSAAMVQGNMGNLLKELGEYEAALKLYHESGEAFRSLNRVQHEAISLGNEGELLIKMHRLSEARRVLDKSISLCQRTQFKAEGAFLTYLARVERLEGNLEQADVLLQRGEQLLRASTQQYHLGVLMCERGLWAVALGDIERAQQIWADAEKIAADLEANPRSELGAAVQELHQVLPIT